jgi:hypothetical protein
LRFEGELGESLVRPVEHDRDTQGPFLVLPGLGIMTRRTGRATMVRWARRRSTK